MRDESIHEKRLLNLIDEDRLRYTGSIVLGLNDALVELTGALAGLTFALQDTKRIAFAGFITGIAASLSMAASEYLSARTDEGPKSALRASAYTGTAYVITVIFLITPYLIFSNYFVCLAFTLVNALLVILLFNYYISVARDLPFRRRFFEMAAISLGVAAFTCTSVSVAGEMMQDLKAGHILGCTPWKMQVGDMFGVTAAALAMAIASGLARRRARSARRTTRPSAGKRAGKIGHPAGHVDGFAAIARQVARGTDFALLRRPGAR